MGKANKVTGLQEKEVSIEGTLMMNVVQFDMVLYFIPLSSSKYLEYKSFFFN